MHNIIYTGAYLSQNGRFIEPNSSIPITDIGTSSPQQLVCTSDRKPCCRDQPQYGEWKFPDGSQVIHISERPVPTAFHRNRDNDGNVYLYRVSSDIMSPTGRFCCEIEDATHMNQTICVNLGELAYTVMFSSLAYLRSCSPFQQTFKYTIFIKANIHHC